MVFCQTPLAPPPGLVFFQWKNPPFFHWKNKFYVMSHLKKLENCLNTCFWYAWVWTQHKFSCSLVPTGGSGTIRELLRFDSVSKLTLNFCGSGPMCVGGGRQKREVRDKERWQGEIIGWKIGTFGSTNCKIKLLSGWDDWWHTLEWLRKGVCQEFRRQVLSLWEEDCQGDHKLLGPLELLFLGGGAHWQGG